jgi:heavy metal-binding protein
VRTFLAILVLSAQVAQAPALQYVCPMHPDVRSATPGRCPRCAMALVPRSADVGNEVLELSATPTAPLAGRPVALTFVVRYADTDQPIRNFDIQHERPFHLFVVSHDLDYFAHVHPRLAKDGRLHISVVLPRPGPYQLYGDFAPSGHAPQMLQRSLVTAGYHSTLAAAAAHLVPDLTPKIVRGLRMRIRIPDAVAGRELLVTSTVEDARSGAPITDLQPYLGAQGHLMVISEDLADGLHSHPEANVSSASGPDVVFQMRFPRAGLYRLWFQVQHGGEVATFSFTVPVQPAP